VFLARGTQFGPYEILELLGAGGMGEVYHARDSRLDRTVAIVADIRKALDDDSAHPRFVRTVHRFGYAFQESPTRVPARASGVRFRLLWTDGRAGLSDGEHVLSRDPYLELFFDSPGVSRRHAIIGVDGDEATVEDLGSKNGTFVGDRRLDSSARLADGDVIRLGSVALTFKVLRARGSTYTEPRKSR
jgi:FHA domain